jgi:hypothetical protein
MFGHSLSIYTKNAKSHMMAFDHYDRSNNSRESRTIEFLRYPDQSKQYALALHHICCKIFTRTEYWTWEF